ncbi:MAG: MarR family transcriptional regulator [Acidimicrobiia bacterium]|nr:MarR family transcriptional regulator [Acidimicrobiia bacterium]
MAALADADYERLLEFRDGLRRFLRWSEEQAATVGLTPAQHQLLLAVRGHHGRAPTVSDVADHLLLRRHSVVGLVNRAAAAGLLTRASDPADQRVVRVQLTKLGERRLQQLSALHLEELRRLAPSLRPVWQGLGAAG